MKYIGLIIGILFFVCFAWDVEHNRTFFTWLILLLSILNLLSFAIDEIVDRIKKHIDDKEK